MIEVKDLTKTYHKNRGIDHISFSVKEGEVLGFLGPNGAGKSTTMNILTGYLSASEGEALIAGIDVLENPLEAKKHIGYLPEQPPLYPGMTVEDYLDFVYDLKGARQKSRNKHIDGICELVGLTEVSHRVIGHLSKGYRQRVGLAQALIGDPDVLVLDEPTVGLDPRQIVEIRGVIREMGKKRTIILSTHILSEVSAVCERVLVISEGVIVADDKPERLAGAAANGQSLLVRVAGSREAVMPLLQRIDGVRNVQHAGVTEEGSFDCTIESRDGVDIRKPLFQALAKAGHPLLLLRPQSASLEEVFMRLTEASYRRPEDAGRQDGGGEQPEQDRGGSLETAEDEGGEQ